CSAHATVQLPHGILQVLHELCPHSASVVRLRRSQNGGGMIRGEKTGRPDAGDEFTPLLADAESRLAFAPSPNTVCVARLYKSQPREWAAASRRLGRVIFTGGNSAAECFGDDAGIGAQAAICRTANGLATRVCCGSARPLTERSPHWKRSPTHRRCSLAA